MIKTPWIALLLLAGCGPKLTAPPSASFAGLPVSGTLADAQRAGFGDCIQPDWDSMRCRRHGVMLAGAGPFEAAVDLAGHDGSGGFNQLILWHDSDQYAVYKITDFLDRHGWLNCSTGTGDRGDQILYMRSGTRVRISMDLSYWGKRRVRLLPEWNTETRCRASRATTITG
jgi:hypothetical protein